MISASTAYQNAVNADGRSFRVRLYLNGTLLSADIASAKICRGACGGEPYAGTVFVPYMECELRGVSASLEGETITVQIGVLTDRANDTWEYVNAGTYVVSKPEVAGDVTTFTAVGTLGTIGSGTATITATTYSAIISEIQTATGVTITTQGVTVSGSPTDSFEDGITWRDALAEVAKALGGFLTETVNGTWVIAAYCSGSTVAIGADRSQEPPQYDEQSYTLASQTVESGVVEMAMGNPLLDPWDVLSVTDINGVTHLVPCLQITHELHGGLSTMVDASVDTETQALANIQGPATKNMQYFWVDGDGAHVTTVPKDQFLANPSGGNALLDSDSIEFKDGATSLAEFGANGTELYDEERNRIFWATASGTVTSKKFVDKPNWVLNNGSKPSNSYYFAYPPIASTSISMVFALYDKTNQIESDTKSLTATPGSHAAYVGSLYFRPSGGTAYSVQCAFGYQQATSTPEYIYGYVTNTVQNPTNYEARLKSVSWNYASLGPQIYFGTRGTKSGEYTAAFGEGLEAAYDNQFACGMYNNNLSDNIFEVGGGSDDDNRVNLFSIAKSGYAQVSGSASYINLNSTTSQKTLRVISNSNSNRGLYSPDSTTWLIRYDANDVLYLGKAPIFGSHSSAIGTMLDGSSTKALASTTSMTGTGVTFTLDEGTWIVTASIRYATNATGNRRISLIGSSAINASRASTPAISGQVTDVQMSCVATPTGSVQYEIGYMQNSGSSLSGCVVSWRAVRIA